MKQFGDEWQELLELVWYKRLLLNEYNTIEAVDVGDHKQHDQGDEVCVCLEYDIGELIV